jgi:hypothetical protein
MLLHIPAIGDVIYLSKPWTFRLVHTFWKNRKFALKLPTYFPMTERTESKWERKVRYERRKTMLGREEWIEAGALPWETMEGQNGNMYVSTKSCLATDAGAHETVRKWQEISFPAGGVDITLPVNSALRIDKITVVRNNQYDSVVFTCTNMARDPLSPKTKKKISSGKFEVSRHALSNLEYELQPIAIVQDDGKNRFEKQEIE